MHEHASYSYCACSWHQQTNPSRKKIFYTIFYFGILLQKNWLRLWQQFKLNMESCEPVDEEELPTFSLGWVFNPPKKMKRKRKQRTSMAGVIPFCNSEWVQVGKYKYKCYKTIGLYVSCAYIKIWSTWEVWRALKK